MRGVAHTVVCVVLLTAAVAHGRSIDNPAEDSSAPRPVISKALAKVEHQSRAIPSPVQVYSGVLLVKGNSESEGRGGRSFTIDGDGIPVIDGVRSPDDNSPIHRNARIINNILVLPEDEAKFAKLNSVMVTSSNIHHANSKAPASTLTQGDVELISKSAIVTRSKLPYSDRQARVLNRGSSKTTNSQNRAGRFFPSDSSQEGEKEGEYVKASGDKVGKFPAFYYRRYYDNERAGIVADDDEHDDNIGESSEQVVSYSYFTSPEDGSSSKSFGSRDSSKGVIYGTGVASKPNSVSSSSKNDLGFPISTSVSKSVSSSVSFIPSTKDTQTNSKETFDKLKPSSILQNSVTLTDSRNSASSHTKQSTFVPSNSIHHSSAATPAHASAHTVTHHNSVPQAPVFNHHQSPAPVQASSHAPAHAPPFSHAPASGHSNLIQANGGEFTIHQKTFQAHPGAPTFNIPIPIPTSQLPSHPQVGSHVQPLRQDQIQQHFETQQQQYRQPQPTAHQAAAASEAFHRVTHQQPTAHAPYYETQHTVVPEKTAYEKMFEPFTNIGSSVSKAFETVGNSVRRGYSSLQLPERMSNVVSTIRKSSMNDYIQRTVSDGNLPLVAGAAVLGSLGLIATAVAISSSNITIGKRSIDDPAEDFLFQMVDEFIEPTIFDRLEEYTSWADSECSKRVFCDVMSLVSDDYIYTIEKRMGLFLNM
ncbi:unnamed protein product, partial [Meganyctiphanes norvegica]